MDEEMLNDREDIIKNHAEIAISFHVGICNKLKKCPLWTIHRILTPPPFCRQFYTTAHTVGFD